MEHCWCWKVSGVMQGVAGAHIFLQTNVYPLHCRSVMRHQKHTHSLPLNMVNQLQHESGDAESKNGALLVLESQWCDARGGRGTHFPTD